MYVWRRCLLGEWFCNYSIKAQIPALRSHESEGGKNNKKTQKQTEQTKTNKTKIQPPKILLGFLKAHWVNYTKKFKFLQDTAHREGMVIYSKFPLSFLYFRNFVI